MQFRTISFMRMSYADFRGKGTTRPRHAILFSFCSFLFAFSSGHRYFNTWFYSLLCLLLPDGPLFIYDITQWGQYWTCNFKCTDIKGWKQFYTSYTAYNCTLWGFSGLWAILKGYKSLTVSIPSKVSQKMSPWARKTSRLQDIN